MARSKSTTAAPAPEAATPETTQAEAAETIPLTGRLCADPVLRHTNSGKAVTTIRLAINEPAKPVRYQDVVAWNGTAETICQFLTRGRAVTATGHMQERSWDYEGKTYTVTELSARTVEFLTRAQAAALPKSEREVA